MREFKRFEGQLGVFVVGAVDDVELQPDGSQTVADFGCLAGEGVLVDLVGQAEVQEAILLGDEERDLAFEFGTLGLGLGLLVLRLRSKDGAEPVTDRVVFDHHAIERVEHLTLDFGLGDTNPGVSFGEVAAAAVIHVGLLA